MFKSLKTTLFFSHLGIILLAAVVLAVFFFPMITKQLTAREKVYLQDITEHGAAHIKMYFERQSQLLRQLAGDKVVLDYLDNYRELALAAHLISHQDDLPIISYINEQGYEEVRVEQGRLLDSRQTNYRERPFFQEAMARPDEVVISHDTVLRQDEGPVIDLTYVKHHYFGDEFAGMLLAQIPLRKLAQSLLSIRVGEAGLVVLEDLVDGSVFAISSSTGEIKSLDRNVFFGQEHRHDRPDHKDMFVYKSRNMGNKTFMNHIHLPEYQLVLWTALSEQEMMAGTWAAQKTTLLFLALIATLALSVAYFLAHTITTPLASLAQASRTIARGENQEPIRIRSQDEIGALVKSFNIMVENLHQTTISRDYFDTILSSMRESLIVTDREGRIQTVNMATVALLGREPSELVGLPLTDILLKDQDKKEKFMAHLCSGEGIVNKELVYLGHGDRAIPVLFSAASLDNPNHITDGVVCVAIDMTERNLVLEELRESQVQLEQLSISDELTGLLNRRGFMTMAARQLLVADRVKADIILLYLDVDGLKQINDTLGHQEGDALICDTADLLRCTFRGTDIISRLGGDEFAVLLLNTGETDLIKHRFADKIRAMNEESDRPYQLSISCGMVVYDLNSPCSLDEFLSRADTLMYEQKMGKKQAAT